jgi:hypothetical protein
VFQADGHCGYLHVTLVGKLLWQLLPSESFFFSEGFMRFANKLMKWMRMIIDQNENHSWKSIALLDIGFWGLGTALLILEKSLRTQILGFWPMWAWVVCG